MIRPICIGFLGLSLLTGCAFRSSDFGQEPLSASKPVAGSTLSLAVDWSQEPDPKLGELLKATRVIEAAEGSFRARGPVTLPVTAVRTLFLGVDLPVEILSEPIRFTRSRYRSGEVVHSVISEPTQVDEQFNGKQRVVIQIGGLNALMPQDRSTAGDLEIEIFGTTRRLASFSVELRTPPSRLQIETLSVRDWQSQASDTQLGLLKFVLAGKRLNMVRALRIRNDEFRQVEILVPRRIEASMVQWTNPMRYRDTGCGYAIEESPSWDSFTDDVLVLPIDERLIPEAEASLGRRELQDRLSLTVPPGEDRLVGTFAIGNGANGWMDSGPAQPILSQATVPNTCYDVCLITDCFHPREPFNLGLRPQRCTCIAWETRRHVATVTVGVNRGPVLLNVPPEYTDWSVRYSDRDFTRESEARMLSVLPESSEVSWF